MITIPSGARVLLATRPVDFRKGAHGLAALASAVLGEDPFSGAVVVFRAKRADRVEDPGVGCERAGSGVEAIAAGRLPLAPPVAMPPAASQTGRQEAMVMDGVVRLSAVEFAALFDGLDWTRVQAVRRIPTPTAAG